MCRCACRTDAQAQDVTSDNGAGVAPAGEALKNILESLIFVSDEPVTPKKVLVDVELIVRDSTSGRAPLQL